MQRTGTAGRADRRPTVNALNTVAVLGAAGAPILGALSGQASGAGRLALVVGAGLCSALVVAVSGLIQRRGRRRVRTAEQVAVEAEVELATALNGALAPMTSYLAELAVTAAPQVRARIAGMLGQAVVEAAVRLTSPGARSAFYAADLDAGVLTREVYAGRAALPRDEFVGGTPDGDSVLDLVERGDLVVIDDVRRDPMVVPSDGSGYRCVVAAAVTAGERRLGMLTVDAPRVAAFSGADVELVRVLANLLASGLAQAQARVP